MYVEFLVAFMPLFMLFLAVCQLALLASARLVVQHAAFSAVRSAIVVLEEPPDEHGGAPRGSLSEGRPHSGPEAVLAALDFGFSGAHAARESTGTNGRVGVAGLQQGARMTPVRTAAYLPLLILAPNESAVTDSNAASLKGSLPAAFASRLPFALEYTRAATVVTVHSREGAEQLAVEPIGRTAPVTVRVTALFHCGVPLVAALMCRSLGALTGSGALADRLKLAESAEALDDLVVPSARFIALTAEATLPNQGAGYYASQGES